MACANVGCTGFAADDASICGMEKRTELRYYPKSSDERITLLKFDQMGKALLLLHGLPRRISGGTFVRHSRDQLAQSQIAASVICLGHVDKLLDN